MNLLRQQLATPRPPLVRVARAPVRVVPRRVGSVYQLLLRPAPGPGLGERERPEADVEGTEVRPHEPHLLLARPDDLLAIAEGRLQGEPVGHRRADLGRVRIR